MRTYIIPTRQWYIYILLLLLRWTKSLTPVAYYFGVKPPRRLVYTYVLLYMYTHDENDASGVRWCIVYSSSYLYNNI